MQYSLGFIRFFISKVHSTESKSRANERRTGFPSDRNMEISWTQPSKFEVWNDAESGVKENRGLHDCCYEGDGSCSVQDD